MVDLLPKYIDMFALFGTLFSKWLDVRALLLAGLPFSASRSIARLLQRKLALETLKYLKYLDVCDAYQIECLDFAGVARKEKCAFQCS